MENATGPSDESCERVREIIKKSSRSWLWVHLRMKGMHEGSCTNPCLEVGIERVRRSEGAGLGCLEIVCRRTIAGSTGRGGVRTGGRCWQVTTIEIVGPITGALVHEGLLQHLGDLGTVGTVGQLVRSNLSTAVATAAARSLRCHHLTGNATSVGGLSDGRQDGTNGVDNVLTGFCVSEIHGRLDNVVGKRVAKHLLELIALQYFLDHVTSRRIVSSAKALLDDIGAELLLRKRRHIAREGATHRVGEQRLSKIQNVLDNVVAERILD